MNKDSLEEGEVDGAGEGGDGEGWEKEDGIGEGQEEEDGVGKKGQEKGPKPHGVRP